ncbi:winged helix-turn-helix transcriptional regulator [Abyssisolibacter fermentans]|uniref:winged helix-turn-helix transcriptional regulator n=1 Tax=Abyssisolibacter fermentans TaxID=1766203 RepID=UPI000836B311|nr:helix-turn-helix domain-containing protein [Abyssisolibacter fermentans]
MHRYNQDYVSLALSVIGGKWKFTILWHLREDPKRFNELLRSIPNITKKMLVQQLRQLENDQIVHREVHNIVPPKVEYSITEYGATLCPVLQALHNWGEQHQQLIELESKK